jgi:hypothetical protein
LRRRYARKPPTLDSQRARAGAQMFLTGARSLDGITAEWLARTYNLEAKTATYMLTIARQRRERTG